MKEKSSCLFFYDFKFGKYPTGHGSKPRVFIYCNRTSHTIHTYYKKHGLSPHIHCLNVFAANAVAYEGNDFGVVIPHLQPLTINELFPI